MGYRRNDSFIGEHPVPTTYYGVPGGCRQRRVQPLSKSRSSSNPHGWRGRCRRRVFARFLGRCSKRLLGRIPRSCKRQYASRPGKSQYPARSTPTSSKTAARTSSKTAPTSQPVSDPTVVPTRFLCSGVPPCTSQPKKSFSYSGALLRNNLPQEMRDTDSIGLFKRKISNRIPDVSDSHTAIM